MNATLYICATPIGNLRDISFRTIDTLNFVDLIAAEDTRRSIKLLNYYNIKTKLTSYHEHNKIYKGEKLVQMLLEGTNIALITDAGMPCISDPGVDLVRLCRQSSIKITVIPGACAVSTSLAISGVESRRYVFEGFLPYENKKLLLKILQNLSDETRTSIFYEAPHRIIKTLVLFSQYIKNRKITIARELTKLNEEVLEGTACELILYFKQTKPLGEFVLIIEGESLILKEQKICTFENITLEQHYENCINSGYTKNESLKKVAAERGMKKRDVYTAIFIK